MRFMSYRPGWKRSEERVFIEEPRQRVKG